MLEISEQLYLGDVVEMRKQHPCGGYQWEIVRVGAAGRREGGGMQRGHVHLHRQGAWTRLRTPIESQKGTAGAGPA